MSESNYVDCEAEEVISSCAKCGQSAEQYLALQCEHHLCLPCAGKNIHQQPSESNRLTCEICSCATLLDPKTVSVLMSYNSNLSRELCGISGSHSIERREMTTNRGPELSLTGIPSAEDVREADSPRTSESYCAIHPDEPTSLYCLTCETECLCVECMVSSHRNHDVRNVKKSLHVLREKIDLLNLKFRTKIEALTTSEGTLSAKRREIVEFLSRFKENVSANFADLRARLDAKEKELLAFADRTIAERTATVDDVRAEMRERVEDMVRLHNRLEGIYATGDVCAGLNFLARGKDPIQRMLEDTTSKLLHIPEISALTCFVDTSSIRRHIEELQKVRIEIAAVRGVDSDDGDKGLLAQVLEERSIRGLTSQPQTPLIDRANSPEQTQQTVSPKCRKKDAKSRPSVFSMATNENDNETTTCRSANRRMKDRILNELNRICLLYTSPSPRDRQKSRMPSSA
eukprot:TRINITY_DN10364_c0_g1_i3.p1 TRINITY_DN10364_c0_g1~~TRINITY_DN10364_c0_g1_i3.p1  ORF type:complete len:459 (-),score=85.32 TRINITY_DN10364_c0_g1_i3:12-1388(-)